MSSEIDLEALREARWFAGKHRRIDGARVVATFANGALRVAEVAYDDGPAERYLLVGDLSWADLLRAPPPGLELRVADPALLAARGPERIPSTDQSNTLLTIDDTLLVKAYRKLEAGVHPEVELGAALAGAGAPVPRHAGSLHWIAPDGTETAIALLQEYVGGAVSGWEAPIDAVAAALRAGTIPDTSPYVAAGHAAGALHAALAARLGTERDATAPARWRAEAEAALTAAVALDPEAAGAEDAIRRRLAALEDVAAPLLTRIHGDLHFAQFLRTPDRALIVDLEGDPTAPLAARRRPNTPLRDLAALLRSIDHIGTAAARRADGNDPTTFIADASAAALDAYEAATEAAVDRPLLAALELASECRELVYAHRVVPEWAYAPRAGLTRLLARAEPTPS
jgi:maltokinase